MRFKESKKYVRDDNAERLVVLDTIAKFSIVPYEEFVKSFKKINGINELSDRERFILMAIYGKIQLPERSTDGSAGYDIHAPYGFTLEKDENIIIPTGIRCEFDADYGMFILPRSGLGTKQRLMMANTIPLIDSDYSFADNSGHIMLKLCYDGIKPSNQVLIQYNAEQFSHDESICLNTNEKTRISESEYTYNRLEIKQNDRIVQAVFVKLGFAEESDEVKQKRTDGLGSTGN